MGGKMARSVVFRGTKAKTYTGLTKTDLVKNKRGKIVTKKSLAAGKKNYSNIKGWVVACQKARKALGIKGFVAIKKGSDLYKKAKELYQWAYDCMPMHQLGAWGCPRPLSV